jgi:imidazolonepropionase-like amidohydrolase
MVKGGMAPREAIRSATQEAAKLLGKWDNLGSVEPGKYADLVAVDANPLGDVSVLEDVNFVMKGGIVYKRNGRPVAAPGGTRGLGVERRDE